ncbi:MAG TPA: hypothetical protein GXX75_05785 [Clostridiales bacterium]|nr:hypothetical protein [Clostridiales bacterium]
MADLRARELYCAISHRKAVEKKFKKLESVIINDIKEKEEIVIAGFSYSERERGIY